MASAPAIDISAQLEVPSSRAVRRVEAGALIVAVALHAALLMALIRHAAPEETSGLEAIPVEVVIEPSPESAPDTSEPMQAAEKPDTNPESQGSPEPEADPAPAEAPEPPASEDAHVEQKPEVAHDENTLAAASEATDRSAEPSQPPEAAPEVMTPLPPAAARPAVPPPRRITRPRARNNPAPEPAVLEQHETGRKREDRSHRADEGSTGPRRAAAVPSHTNAAAPRRAAAGPAEPRASAPRASASTADAAAYRASVYRRVQSARHYPESARASGTEGSALLQFTIDAGGRLVRVSMMASSGKPDLDAEALASVRRASPFPAPPPGVDRTFPVRLTFRMGEW